MRTGSLKTLLGQFDQAVELRAAAGENESGGNLRFETGAAQFVADQRQQFLRARLDDVRQHAREDRARRAVAHAGDFDRAVFVQQFAERRSRARA